MCLLHSQTATTAGNFRRTTMSPATGRYLRLPALGPTTSFYTKITGSLYELFCLVGQTRNGYRGLWQGLQQKAGTSISLSTGLHFQLHYLDVDCLGSWHEPQLGRKNTTWATEVYPSGTSVRLAFPLTHNPAYGQTASANPFCDKVFMKSLAILS